MNLVWNPEHHTQFCRNSGLGGQSEGCCGYSALRRADPTCGSFTEHSFALCTAGLPAHHPAAPQVAALPAGWRLCCIH